MKITNAKCPCCGGELNITHGSKTVKCEYCDSILTIENGSVADPNARAEEAGYAFEKGRQRAQEEREQAYTSGTAQPVKKKRRTWLWVLGWIFIFPLPLTILLLRKKTLNSVIKYGIIILAWILYLGFVASPSQSSALAMQYQTVMETPV